MSSATSTSLQPCQCFTLAALGCATAVSFIARGQGAMVIILLSGMIAPPAFAEGFGASTVARAASEGGTASAERVCASCQTVNDHDARFCKSCGQPLAGR